MPKLIANELSLAEFEVLKKNVSPAPSPLPLLTAEYMHAAAVIAICFVIEALALSARSYFAVCLELWEKDFGVNRTTVSSCRAVQLIAQAIATAVAGQFSDSRPQLTLSFGLALVGASLLASAASQTSWQLFLAYGLCAGVGFGFTNFNVATACLTRLVPHSHIGLATGIAMAGGPVGQMVLVPLFQWIALQHGWRTGFAVSGCVMLALVPVTVLLLGARVWSRSVGGEGTDPPLKHGPKSGGSASSTSRELEQMEKAVRAEEPERIQRKLVRILAAPWFALVAFPFFLCGITAVGVVESHLIALATSRGIGADSSALSFGVLMLANGCGEWFLSMISCSRRG